MHTQHCSHWCPGAKAPGHQYPQCWLNFHWIGLTHWGRVIRIYVGNLTNIGSDNGLSPGRRQAIIWSRDSSNAGILLMGLIGTNFSEVSSAKYQPLKFHWILFQMVQLTIFQHWFGAIQATSHYLNQWWLVYRRIYASHGLSELILCGNITFIVNISKKQATIWRKMIQLFNG